MYLYLISQDEVSGFNTYDSAVVRADSPVNAATIHPSGNNDLWGETGWTSWCKRPGSVKVELIGTARLNTKPGVVCASYHNAG